DDGARQGRAGVAFARWRDAALVAGADIAARQVDAKAAAGRDLEHRHAAGRGCLRACDRSRGLVWRPDRVEVAVTVGGKKYSVFSVQYSVLNTRDFWI